MLVPPVAAVTLAVANAWGAFQAQKSAQMIASRQRQNPAADLKTDDMMRVRLASNCGSPFLLSS